MAHAPAHSREVCIQSFQSSQRKSFPHAGAPEHGSTGAIFRLCGDIVRHGSLEAGGWCRRWQALCEVPVPKYKCGFPVSLCTLCLSSVVHSKLKAEVFPACRSTGATSYKPSKLTSPILSRMHAGRTEMQKMEPTLWRTPPRLLPSSPRDPPAMQADAGRPRHTSKFFTMR
jgi:hypothetical protein